LAKEADSDPNSFRAQHERSEMSGAQSEAGVLRIIG